MKMATCIHCKLNKPKIKSGIMTQGRSIYVDAANKRWGKGNTCPECLRAATRRRLAAYRARKREAVKSTDTEVVLYGMDTPKYRNCRECGSRTTNYFHCTSCLNYGVASKLAYGASWEAEAYSGR